MQQLEPGMVLAGRYRLDVKLGEGGMGIVWAATHVVTRQSVALKLLLPASGSDVGRVVKRFMREARAASAVSHPNVVVIYDVMELDAQTPMMVMELLRGETLGQRLDRERRIGVGELARVLLPVVSALGTTHAVGIVHRDIKPDNIFLAKTPDGTCVKVLDFGIAKLSPMQEDAAATATLTATNSIVGTPYYMAPEQIFGEKDIDHRADIWALGVIAYECLVGTRPTDGDNVGQIMKVIATNRIVPVDRVASDVPADLTAIIMAALSAERSERPTLHEMKTVLARYTDLHVRDFADPQAPLASGSTLPSGESDKHVSLRVSDSARPMAPTVASGERPQTITQTSPSPTAATLDAGVTQLDPRPGRPWRWLTLALAVVAVAATSALTVSLASRPSSSSSTPSVTAKATGSAPVEATTVVPKKEDVAVDAASVVASTTATKQPHPPAKPSARASATAPALTATGNRPALDHGGVVETVPY